ncbi:hypothetical protein [Mucilaginibacter sp.]
MRLPALLSFAGFVLIIAATFCPLLRVFHVANWDAYALNKPYAMVLLLIPVVGIIGTVFNQIKITRLAAWLSLVLVVVFYIAAILKVETSFGFIPFHSISGFLSSQLKFKWGWYLLFISSLLAVGGTLVSKKAGNFKID